MKYLIFTYGSLRRGFSRHFALHGQTYLGIAETQPKYLMYKIADFPGLVKSESGKKIWGELYEIDEQCLGELDQIEGVCFDLFQRHEVLFSHINLVNLPVSSEVFKRINNKSAEAYFYQRDTSNFQEVGSCWHLT